MNLFSKQEEKPPPQDQVPKILNEEFLIPKKSYGANSLEKLREINNKNSQTGGIVKGLDQEETAPVHLNFLTIQKSPPNYSRNLIEEFPSERTSY